MTEIKLKDINYRPAIEYYYTKQLMKELYNIYKKKEDKE